MHRRRRVPMQSRRGGDSGSRAGDPAPSPASGEYADPPEPGPGAPPRGPRAAVPASGAASSRAPGTGAPPTGARGPRAPGPGAPPRAPSGAGGPRVAVMPSGAGGPRAAVTSAPPTTGAGGPRAAAVPGAPATPESGVGGTRPPVPAAAATARLGAPSPGSDSCFFGSFSRDHVTLDTESTNAASRAASRMLFVFHPAAQKNRDPHAPALVFDPTSSARLGTITKDSDPVASASTDSSQFGTISKGSDSVAYAPQFGTISDSDYQPGLASASTSTTQCVTISVEGDHQPVFSSPSTSSFQSGTISMEGEYQPWRSMVACKEFQARTARIREALSRPDVDCGPSTPPPPCQSRTGSKKSRIRARKRQSPTHKTSTFGSKAKKDFNKQRMLFKKYLHTFCSQLADQMWQEKSFHMAIDFDELKHENKTLAYDIANNYEEIKSTLHDATGEFLFEKFSAKAIDDGRFTSEEMLDSTIRCSTKLCFSRMPKSIMSLEDFLKIHKTTTRYLFRRHRKCRHLIAVFSPVARNILRKIVAYVTNHHKDGIGWDGKWRIADWEVVDGEYVQLQTTPVKLDDRSMFHNDLEGISTEIIIKLTDTGNACGLYPAYLLDLSQQLRKTETSAISDDDFLSWFCHYLQYHPALMSSKARSTLLKGLYSIAVHLDYNKDPAYDVIFNDKSFVAGWSNFVFMGRSGIHPIMWKTFWDNNYPDEGTDPTNWHQPYQDIVGDLLKMVRHIFVHADRATRTYYDGQLMKHSCEPELFAAEMFKKFFPELIKLIFRKGKMLGEFATEWEFYKATKDFVFHELPQIP